MMKLVGVRPGSAVAASRRLFDALELAFEVRFDPWREDARYDALLAADAAGVPAGVPAVVFANGALRSENVTVHDGVDRRLRGLELSCATCGPELDGGAVLASGSGGPVWTRAGATDRVRTALPELAPGDVLRDAFWDARVLGAVAIVELLRALTAHTAPPLRATMLFDDPNLRWRSYGYINYTDLVRHSDEHGYHSSMAMIPLDAWRPHPSAVALFRERPDRLSLAMHGNDHRIEELFSQHDPEAALALGAQALRRVARFEAASGLRVGRVMVPPHGMCSSTMARALGRLPFAALASIHPFPWAITPPQDELLAGWGPATFAEGCPVIPRVLFDATDAEVALRAYMDHPIVLYGHHDDLAGGLDVLADAAARVNRLGEVRWVAPEEIAHSNAAVRRDGDTLTVRPFAQRVRVDRASALIVESPSPAHAGWSLGADAELRPFGVPVDAGGEPAEVWLRSHHEVDPGSVPAPALSVWPRLRRIATESRDRLAPLRRSR
jgi:hypothetical protein